MVVARERQDPDGDGGPRLNGVQLADWVPWEHLEWDIWMG